MTDDAERLRIQNIVGNIMEFNTTLQFCFVATECCVAVLSICWKRLFHRTFEASVDHGPAF